MFWLAAVGGLALLLLTGRGRSGVRQSEGTTTVFWGGRYWEAGALRHFLRREFGSASVDELRAFLASEPTSEIDELLRIMRERLGMGGDPLYQKLAAIVAGREPLLDPFADTDDPAALRASLDKLLSEGLISREEYEAELAFLEGAGI
jgi:hypothetical protein